MSELRYLIDTHQRASSSYANNKPSSNNQPYTITKPNNLPHTITKPNNNVNPPKSNDQPHNVTMLYTSNHQTPNLTINACHTPKHKTKSMTHTTSNYMLPPHLSIAPIIHTIPPHSTIAHPNIIPPKHPTTT